MKPANKRERRLDQSLCIQPVRQAQAVIVIRERGGNTIMPSAIFRPVEGVPATLRTSRAWRKTVPRGYHGSGLRLRTRWPGCCSRAPGIFMTASTIMARVSRRASALF